jgi:subtilisin-like proprotein convertase family protein
MPDQSNEYYYVNDLNGIVSTIQIDKEGIIESTEVVFLDTFHTYRGDLFVPLISPDNAVIFVIPI